MISLPLRVILLLSLTAAPAVAQPVVTLPARDRPLAARTPVLFTVGEEDGAGPEVFGSVTAVAFDARENLYVLDGVNDRVVVFDSLGRVLRTIGRRGGGPGEFQTPHAMTVLADGRLVVTDLAHRSTLVFAPDGRFSRSVPFPAGTLITGERLATHPAGGIVASGFGNPASRDPYSIGDEGIFRYPLASGVPDPLLILSRARDRLADGSRELPPAFAATPRHTVLPDGALLVARETGYALEVLGPEGRVVRQIRRAIPPRRVTSADREAERRRRSAGGAIRITGGDVQVPAVVTAQVGAALRDVDFAEVMPVIRALRTDAAGRVWLQRSGPSLDRPGPIDLLSSDGRYLGTVSGVALPDAFSRGGRIAVVVRDELGVPRVQVRRFSLAR